MAGSKTLCTCQGSYLPHYHADSGIVDATAAEVQAATQPVTRPTKQLAVGTRRTIS